MPEDDHLPRLLSGRYRLEATIGHGGMGIVYRGIDLMMKRSIAVKLVRGEGGEELDDEAAGRFLREAKNTARLQHEHIVEVFDLGRTEEGGLYFVMELLNGESLSARLRRAGIVPPETTVHIGRQICDALEVAHTAGIVHRDLKPANIMLVARAGDPDFVKVLDFGVAKSNAADQQTQLTRTGMLVGTVDYMSPEQITGKTLDGRADMYALGVVLYRMLAGRPPFRDNGVPALIHAHLNTMPQPLIEVAPDVPNALDRVVLRCLAKNPDRRYESMTELARALRLAIAPDSLPLVDLEYRSPSDDYSDADPTKLVRESGRIPDDATINQTMSFDDSTLKFDPNSKSRVPTDDKDDWETVPRAEAFSRPRQSSPARATKICAMCQTVNPLHARSCVACGVSLDATEQDAVRQRVRASTQPPAIPFVPRPSRPTDPPRVSRPPLPPPLSSDVPVLPWESRPPPPPPPPTVWQRFLSWTGLRGR